MKKYKYNNIGDSSTFNNFHFKDKKENKFGGGVKRYKGLVYDNYLLSILNYLRLKYIFESETIKNKTLLKIFKDKRNLKKNDSFTLMKVKFSDFFFRESKKQVVMTNLITLNRKKERRLLFSRKNRRLRFYTDTTDVSEIFKSRRFFFFFDPKKIKYCGNNIFDRKYLLKLKSENLINNNYNSDKLNITINLDKLIHQKGLIVDDFSTVTNIETSRFPFSRFKTVDTWSTVFVFMFCIVEFLLVYFIFIWYFGSFIDVLTFFSRNFLILSPYYIISNQSNIFGLFLLFYFFFWMITEVIYRLTDLDSMDGYEKSLSFDFEVDFINTQTESDRIPIVSTILGGIYTFFYIFPVYFYFFLFFFKFFSFFFVIFKVFFFPTVAFPFLMLLKFSNFFKDLFFFRYGSKSKFERAFWQENFIELVDVDPVDDTFMDEYIEERLEDFDINEEEKGRFRGNKLSRFLQKKSVLKSSNEFKSYTFPFLYNNEKNSFFNQNDFNEISNKKSFFLWLKGLNKEKEMFGETALNYKRFWKKSFFWLKKDFSINNTDFLLRKVLHVANLKKNKDGFLLEDKNLKKHKYFFKRSNIYYWSFFNKNLLYDLKYPLNDIKKKQNFPRFKYFRLKNPLLDKLQLYRQFFYLTDNNVKRGKKRKAKKLFFNVLKARNKWKRLRRNINPSLYFKIKRIIKNETKNTIQRRRRLKLERKKSQVIERMLQKIDKRDKRKTMPKIIRRDQYDEEDFSIVRKRKKKNRRFTKNFATKVIVTATAEERSNKKGKFNNNNISNYFIDNYKFRKNRLRKVGLAFKSRRIFFKKFSENYYFLLKRFGLIKKLNLLKKRPIDYKRSAIIKNKFVCKRRRSKSLKKIISYKKASRYKMRRGRKKRKLRFKVKGIRKKKIKRKINKNQRVRKGFRDKRFFKWIPTWIIKKTKGGFKKRKRKKLKLGAILDSKELKNWDIRLLKFLYLPFFQTYKKTRFEFDKFKKYSWFLRKFRKKSKRKKFRLKSFFEKRIYDKNFTKKSFFFLRNEEILKRALNYNYFVKSNHPLKNYNFFCPDQDYLGKLLSVYFFRSFRKNKILKKNRSYINRYQYKKKPVFVSDFFSLKKFPQRIILFDEDNINNTIISEVNRPVTILKNDLNYFKFPNISENNLNYSTFSKKESIFKGLKTLKLLFKDLKMLNLRLKMLFFDTLSGEKKSYHIINNKFLNFLQHRMQRSLLRRYREFYESTSFHRRRIFRYNKDRYPFRKRRKISRLAKSKRNLKGYLFRLRITNPGMHRKKYYGRMFRDKLFSLFFEKNNTKFKSSLLKNEGNDSYKNIFKMLPSVKIRPFYDLFDKKIDNSLYFSNNFWNKYRHLLLMESILLEDLFAKKKYKNLNYNFYNKKTKYNVSQFLSKWDSDDIIYLKNLKQNVIGNTLSFTRSKKVDSENRRNFSFLKKGYYGNMFKVKLYKNLMLYRKFRKITLQLEMLKYNIVFKKLDEKDPEFIKWKAQYIKMLFLRKLCILFLLKKKQDSIFFFNYFRLNDKKKKDKTLINNPFITLKKRLKKKTKLFYKDFILWKKWKNFLSMKVKNKLLSRQKEYMDLLNTNLVGGAYSKRSKDTYRIKTPHKLFFFIINGKEYTRHYGSRSIFSKQNEGSKKEKRFRFKDLNVRFHNRFKKIFVENGIKNSRKFLSQDFLKYSPLMIDEDRYEFFREFVLYNNALDEQYIGEGIFDTQESFWLNPITNKKINYKYNAMSPIGIFSKLKKDRNFFLNSFFSRLRDSEEEDQIFDPLKLRNNNYFPKFPVSTFNYSRRFLASKGIGNFFLKKKKIKDFRALKLDDGLNINLNFFLNTKKKIELDSKKSFFLRLGNFIKKGLNLFFLRSKEIIKSEEITKLNTLERRLFFNKFDIFDTHHYLFNLLLRKYLVFLDLNNGYIYSKKINNFGKIKTFILYLRLRKMEKSLDTNLLKNDNFEYLQKFRLPFSRFIFWLLRNELKKKYLFKKMKKGRNIFFNNKLFNIYYPSLFIDHIHNRKRKFFFNKILKRNKSKVYSTLMSKSFKLLFLPKSYKKKIYKKHRVLFGQKNLKTRVNNSNFRNTTNILLDLFNIFSLYPGPYNKKSPISRSLFFSNSVLKDFDNLTVESQIESNERIKRFFNKNNNQDFSFLMKSGLIKKNFLLNYLNLVSKNYVVLNRNKLTFIFNGNGVLNSKKSIKDSFLKNSFLFKVSNANKQNLNVKLFNLLLNLNDLPHGVLDQYGFFPRTNNNIDFNIFRKLSLKRYLTINEKKENQLDYINLLKNDKNFNNFLKSEKYVDVNNFIGLKRRWSFMRHFLYKYIDLEFNIKKKDKLLFEYDFFFYRKYRKYNYILNNIFFVDNIINKKRLVNSNNDFYFDWWNMNLSFFSKYRDQQLFFIKKNLLNNLNIGIKLNNNNLNSKNMKSVFFNINNVLVNSNKNQHNVEMFPRYVGRSMREKLNEFYNRKEHIYIVPKLIRDPYMLYGKLPAYNKLKRVKKINSKIYDSEYKFSEFLKKRYPLFRMLNARYDIFSSEKKNEQRFGSLPNIYAGVFSNKFYEKRQGFRSSFKLNSHHRFVDPRNFIFYPYFVNKKFYNKYSFLFNNKKLQPNLFFNFLINIGFLNKHKFFENRELFHKLNLKGDLVLPIKAKYNFKNSKNIIFYWKQLKNLFKFDSKRNFLIWLKRKYGLNLTSSNQNNSFIWKDKYKFTDSKLKSFTQDLNIENENESLDFLALKTEAVYSNGNIRINLNRSKDDFFFKRQKLLKLIKNSVFSFKAIIGFLYFKYQIFSWNDRLNFHVRLDDSENFIDFELDKIIIDRTNELFLPSYWVYRIPFSNIFYNYFLSDNNFLDSSLTLTEKSEIVMRLNTYLNVFNSNSSNYSKFLYDNSEVFTKIMNETFLLPKMMGYNAFYNIEVQLREKLKLNIINSDFLSLIKINDIILAEQLKKLTYNELYKLILQYENLILDRKQRRFLNLTQVVESDFFFNFEKLFNIFYWEKKSDVLKPFFFMEDKFLLLDKTQYEILSNFSFMEHLYNSSVIGNVSFPQKVWMFDKLLKWFNNSIDLKVFGIFLNSFKFLNIQKDLYFDLFNSSLLKIFDKIYKSNVNFYFENMVSFDWIYSNNFIPFLFYLLNVYFFFLLYFIVMFFYYFWYINFIYKNPMSESTIFVDGSDWKSRPLINQKTSNKFFARRFLNSFNNPLILDFLDQGKEKRGLSVTNKQKLAKIKLYDYFRKKYNPLNNYPIKGLNRFFIKNRRRFLKSGTLLFRKRLGDLRIRRYRQSYTQSLNAHFERTCMPRRFFSILRFSAKKGWQHYSRVSRTIKNYNRRLNFFRNKDGSFVRMKKIFNKFGGIYYNVNLKLLKSNLGLIKNKFNVKKKRTMFFTKMKSSIGLGEKQYFNLRKDNVYYFDIRNLDFFRHLANNRHNFGFKKKFFIFFLRDISKNNINNLSKDYFNFKQREYNQNIYNKFSKLFKTKKFFLRRKDFWLKVKLNMNDLMSDNGKILSDSEKKDNLGKEFREREAQKEAQKKKEKEENERRSFLSQEERDVEDKKIEEEKQREKLEEEKQKIREEEDKKVLEKLDKKNRFFKKKFLSEKAFIYKRTLKRPKSFVFFRNRLFENFAEDQLYSEGFERDIPFIMPKLFSFRFIDILFKGTFFFFKFILIFFIFFFIFLFFYKFYLFLFF